MEWLECHSVTFNDSSWHIIDSNKIASEDTYNPYKYSMFSSRR